MFFLDVTPEESLRRISSRDEDTEMFENIESLRKNRAKSQKFTYNWNVIPSDDAPEVISEKIKSYINEIDVIIKESNANIDTKSILEKVIMENTKDSSLPLFKLI